MKTRYKIPIVIALLVIVIWPQIPHLIWIACEIFPTCSNETSHVSGINFFGTSVNTNLFDYSSEEMAGFFVLGISFSVMALLVTWKIKTSILLKIIIPCMIFLILVLMSMWIEYGIVCNDHVVEHLQRYSNLFDENTTRDTFGMNEIGYPFGVHGGNIQECVDYVFENREE